MADVIALPLPITALDILRKVNARGEVGYAGLAPGEKPSGRNDWSAVEDALDKGWLRYGYDASPDIFSKYHGQERTIYIITELGRAALCSSSEPVS